MAKSNVFVKSALASALLIAFSASSFANTKDENLEKISGFRTSGTAIDIPTVPQTGANVEQLKANLKKIKMPEGFKIELYAVVPDARYMAVAPSTNMLFVGTRKTMFGQLPTVTATTLLTKLSLSHLRSSSRTRTVFAGLKTAS